jgi:acetyltransferase-like isoleucine patch superfamily enzyme
MISSREKAETRYGIKRLFRKICLSVSRHSLVPSSIRVSLCSFAGVNFIDKKTVFIGDDVVFDNIYPEYITVGKNTFITAGVKILTHFLEINPKTYSFKTGSVIIGDNVFIGANVLIVKPVVIGNNSILAAGSVVITDIPDDCLFGGNPAKKLYDRTEICIK